MTSPRQTLLDLIAAIEGVEVRPSPVAGGLALFASGQEIAHFHGEQEIDLRLGKATIRRLGLSHPRDSVFHPGRSVNSAYLEVRFEGADEIAGVADLVRIAAQQVR